MKKRLFILSLVAVALFFVSGCEKVGTYKEGTYFGSSEYESYGVKYVATATVYVDASGSIKNCFIDSTYESNGVLTTKKTLGDAYGMKSTSESMGVIPGGAEWFEQVEAIEEKVIKEQGIDWVKWSTDDATKLDLDTISGVTISANNYIEAIGNALNQAK